MEFNLFISDTTGNSRNCYYKKRFKITSEKDLKAAVSKDYVCAAYQGGYRKASNFLGSDCLCFDCDNEHSEDPKDWAYPEDVQKAFPDAAFAVHYSRNNMKEKNGKAARPKFHVIFPIRKIKDAEAYKKMKETVAEIFPRFDQNALDAARFFFGAKNADVKFYEGTITIDKLLNSDEFDKDLTQGTYGDRPIEQGSRNSTLSRYAAKVIRRAGISEKARELFLERAEKCEPPLSSSELNTIWASAVKLGRKMIADPNYVPPEEYGGDEFKLMPPDYSDVGQAQVLSREYSGKLRFSTATDFIVFNGKQWEESMLNAQGIAQELTERQLKEANELTLKSIEELKNLNAWDLIKGTSKKAVENLGLSDEQKFAYDKYEQAQEYRKFAVKRRDTRYIGAALKEARPALQIKPSELDADEFLLNTPEGAYNLKTGETKPHDANDFITKMTAVKASMKGMDLWLKALNTFFQNDKELIEYVQMLAGIAAVGKVYSEQMIIAHGDGANGKSTFWNTLSRVMGTYSGNLSADTLTVGCKRNVKPELAELKGKRLVIAAELEEGMRLNTSNVKQLCSTDEIYAEKKYRDPFSFTPTHTLVLYTNHLPRVGALDAGTWRRLLIIPFNAEIRGSDDIKNYSDSLFNNAGEAVLQWVRDGAKKAIAKDFKFEIPEAVKLATDKYREENNWLARFLDERCEIYEAAAEKSGEVLQAYRAYCKTTGDYARGTTEFYGALESAGFERKKTRNGILIFGLRLKNEAEQEFEKETESVPEY